MAKENHRVLGTLLAAMGLLIVLAGVGAAYAMDVKFDLLLIGWDRITRFFVVLVLIIGAALIFQGLYMIVRNRA